MIPVGRTGPGGTTPDRRRTRRSGEGADRSAFRSLVDRAAEPASLDGPGAEHLSADHAAGIGSQSNDKSGSGVIETLLDAVNDAGDALRTTQDRQTVARFRDAVRGFVRYVVDQGIGLTETTSPGFLHKRKRYTLLNVIDRRLDELARHVLDRQRERLDLAERLDEINGLLIDLVS